MPVKIVDEQTVNDIITAMLKKHQQCASDYDKIAYLFDGGDITDICERLWKFCKKNFKYVIESEEWQYTSCPYTMLTNGDVDCKNYSLFIGGVLDALKRKGKKLVWEYRFACYTLSFDMDPGHVFVVVNPNTDNIWVDPVLDQFNEHLFYWHARNKRPKTSKVGAIGRIETIGNAAGDALQTQLIEYTEGINDAVQLSTGTGTLNTITQGILLTASLAVPGLTEVLVALKAGGILLNNAFGVGSAGARAYSDLTSLNFVGLFNDLFNGRTYQYQIYWLAAMYQYYVLGKSNITNQDQMTDKDVWPAVKWFIDRTGVYMSGTQTLAALVKGSNAYISLHSVNAGITTDPARVAAAVAVAQTYWTGVPIDPGSSANFLPGRAGSWANTIGVFDRGITQIAQQYGESPEKYVAQTGIDYTSSPTGSAQLITGVNNVWIYSGLAALVVYGIYKS